GLLPVALDGALRDALHAGDLREGEAAEELQVDDGREPRVDGGELVEGVTDASELGTVWHRACDVGRDRRELELAAALLRLPAAHVVDDQTAHHSRRVRHEAVAIRKRRGVAA